uniref:RRM domain-containing protein n=1 Tax=Strigamia maritima TaxID=126957 RepID=T1JGH1_STRMM
MDSSDNNPGKTDGLKIDSRSIFVNNVRCAAMATTSEELKKYFQHCGSIKRVTITCINRAGRSKGVAYIEFDEKDSVKIALALHKSVFNQKTIVDRRKKLKKIVLRMRRNAETEIFDDLTKKSGSRL